MVPNSAEGVGYKTLNECWQVDGMFHLEIACRPGEDVVNENNGNERF